MFFPDGDSKNSQWSLTQKGKTTVKNNWRINQTLCIKPYVQTYDPLVLSSLLESPVYFFTLPLSMCRLSSYFQWRGFNDNSLSFRRVSCFYYHQGLKPFPHRPPPLTSPLPLVKHRFVPLSFCNILVRT